MKNDSKPALNSQDNDEIKQPVLDTELPAIDDQDLESVAGGNRWGGLT